MAAGSPFFNSLPLVEPWTPLDPRRRSARTSTRRRHRRDAGARSCRSGQGIGRRRAIMAQLLCSPSSNIGNSSRRIASDRSCASPVIRSDGALRNSGIPACAAIGRSSFRKPPHSCPVRWPRCSFISESRSASEFRCRAGARRRGTCGRLARSARRFAQHHPCTHRSSSAIGWHNSHFPPHRRGDIPRICSAIALSPCATFRRVNCLHWQGTSLQPKVRRALERFQHGPGAFKIDYALSEPVPWRAARVPARHQLCTSAARSKRSPRPKMPSLRASSREQPFVLVAQPTLFDPTRAPEGKHVLWAYCHVPNGSTIDMTGRIEAQIERFAPGFRDCILARHVSSPAVLESMDANLIGGDISGGAMTLRQFLFRPSCASLRHRNPQSVSLFCVHTARRRRSRHVRLQCRKHGSSPLAALKSRAKIEKRRTQWASALSLPANCNALFDLQFVHLKLKFPHLLRAKKSNPSQITSIGFKRRERKRVLLPFRPRSE